MLCDLFYSFCYLSSLSLFDLLACLVVQVVNVTPRYGKLRDSANKVFGWENFELIR